MLVMMLEDMLEELGHEVAYVAANISQALEIIKVHSSELDGCVLDANLGGEFSTSIAQMLREVHVPFIVVSGYDSRELHRLELSEPSISKPYSMSDLETALQKL